MTYTQNGFIFDDDGRVLTVSMAGGEALPTGAYQQNGFTFDENGKLIVLSDSAQSGSGAILPWTTATAYIVGQPVTYSGSTYTAVDAHTSGATFAGDLATHWALLPVAATTPTAPSSPYGGEVMFSTRGAPYCAITASDGVETVWSYKTRITAPYHASGFRLHFNNPWLNAISIAVSIKTSGGTVIPAFFNGATSKSVALGATVVTDPIGHAVDAAGYFYVIVAVTVSAGQRWPTNVWLLDSRGEGSITGDVTATGNVTGGADGWGYAPFAVTAVGAASGTVTKAVAIVGDSIAYGEADAIETQGPLYGWLARLLNGAVPWINLARGGESAFVWNAGTNNPARRPFLQVPNVVVAYGTNDATFVASNATIKGYIQKAIEDAAMSGARVWAATITPRPGESEHQAHYTYVNDWLRTVPAPLYGIIDADAAVATAPNSWVWATGMGDDPPNAVHPTPAGCAAIAAHSSATAMLANLQAVTLP